ncbi:hypothetical protein A3I56_01500 [Candidatus Roizmanbacteria bacterium RIFCSPLOWO2_02_FULL_43_10]|uniref:PrgI family protein n=2 Tax=Microgenomates group TaxID=1794810 RepID=A0A1F7JW44_9BACT|nr:MAG: hypothetical protein A2693_00215 [Candidatus Curtissbacteria bacterium RIFCSPHIGHO2_01_FULL_40_12]OGK59804.1 MAG: hypothetical protein A3I56_01500 [Candidatus Roizmanbacteria bacterium RIFCSPLOWO2_02_FULL_43_10]
MEQHPVPQHIASFEFKLFGNLTVRQFVTLAIPMSFAAIFFFSNLNPIIRLPLAILFGGFGIFSALVPIGGRPFDKWVVAFIKAILSPTQRIWIKEEKIPEFLNVVTSPSYTQNAPEEITTQGRERLVAYLRSLPKNLETPLDIKEQTSIERLNLTPVVTTQGILPPPIIFPSQIYPQAPVYLGASLPQQNNPAGFRAMKPEEEYLGKMGQALPQVHPQIPKEQAAPAQKKVKISDHAKPYTLAGIEKKLQKSQVGQEPGFEPVELIKSPITITPAAHLASENNFLYDVFIPVSHKETITFIPGIGKTRVRKLHFAPPANFNIANLPIRGEKRFEISEELKKHYDIEDSFIEAGADQAPPVILPTENVLKPQVPAPMAIDQKKVDNAGIFKAQEIIPAFQVKLQTAQGVSLKPQEQITTDSKISINAQKTPAITIPSETLNRAQLIPLTNRPNVLSGLVLKFDESPVVGAIITVRDTNGIPVRALKTNKLGQFLSATSLPNGTYILEVESRQALFEPIKLNLTGEVLSPLAIKEKGGSHGQKSN